ncbi:biotin--[acetyl-CoA-carboxylase] ligase [Candidatus Pelagibacter sp.]|nr:biotin--[acetyl-CoA-carboxylase] ligase [Candidatus Pelagibacter sp.]
MRLKIFRFKRVNSTNSTAIRIIKKTNYQNGMVISDMQTKGRGQYGKKWISLKGNLFVSFFYNLGNVNLSLKRLTRLNCSLVKKFIQIYYKKNIIYKKPNDLLIKKKKICGILQEKIKKFDQNFLIVGIGLNLAKNPIIKNYKTTNLFELIKKKIPKKKIEKELKIIFEKKISKIQRI